MENLPLHPLTRSAIERVQNQPKGSYVFFGPPGIGKHLTAQLLAKRWNCLGDSLSLCQHCQAMASGNFPDVWAKNGEAGQVKIESIRQLVTNLGLTPYYAGGRRVFILDASSGITTEAQNALLKPLEEPPAGSTIIILVAQLNQLLPTIRSRSELVYFAPPPTEALATWLVGQGFSRAEADNLMRLASGRPGLAIQLKSDPALKSLYEAADAGANSLLAPQLFNRLLTAKELAERKEVIGLVIDRLAHQLRRLARNGGSQAVAAGLSALAATRVRLDANITPRAALELLALELPQ